MTPITWDKRRNGMCVAGRPDGTTVKGAAGKWGGRTVTRIGMASDLSVTIPEFSMRLPCADALKHCFASNPRTKQVEKGLSDKFAEAIGDQKKLPEELVHSLQQVLDSSPFSSEEPAIEENLIAAAIECTLDRDGVPVLMDTVPLVVEEEVCI